MQSDDLFFIKVNTFLVILVLFSVRRKKHLEDKNTHDGNKSTTKTSESYSDIDNNVNKNYFVLHKLADNSKKDSTVENVYNDAEDVTTIILETTPLENRPLLTIRIITRPR